MPKQLDTVSRQTAPTTPETPANNPDPASSTKQDTPVAEPTTTSTNDPSTAPQPDEYAALFPEPGVTINPPPNWIWWLLVLLGSLIIGAAGYQYIRANLDDWLSVQPPVASTEPKTVTPIPTEQPSTSASPSAEPTDMPHTTPEQSPSPAATPPATTSPSPTTTIDKSAITMRVLNGTTKTGAAAAAQKVLIEAGFKVRMIGNAKNQSYTQTTIYYQAGHQAEAELIKSSLSDYKPILEENSQTAAPDVITIVIGS